MLVRREAFAAVGGFDEAYRNGSEDIELCLSVGERGGRVVYQPASVVYHLESQTPGRKAHDRENLLRLRRRWETRLLEDEDAIYVADGHTMHASVDASGIRFRLEPLARVPDRAAWERGAEAQECVVSRNVPRLVALLHVADAWPAEPFVLLWAQRLAHRLGLPAEPFCRRLLALGSRRGLTSLLLVTDVPTDDADAPFAGAVLRDATGDDLPDRLERALAHVRLAAWEAAQRECEAIRARAPGFAGFGPVEQLATRVRESRGAAPTPLAGSPAVTFVLAPDWLGATDWAVAVGSYLSAFGPDDPCLLWLRTDRARVSAAECVRLLGPVLAPFGAARFAPLSISDDPDEPLPGARIVAIDDAAAWTPADFRRHLPAAR
jgi:hypothetical protein